MATTDAYRARKRRNAQALRARIAADPESYAKFRERCREYERKYRERRKARFAADPLLLAAHKAKHKKWKRTFDDRQRRRKAFDADFYALYRAGRRADYAEKVAKQGKVYRPMPSMRVPDWAKFGRVVDVHSPWLIENLTPAQRGWARQQGIEKHQWLKLHNRI